MYVRLTDSAFLAAQKKLLKERIRWRIKGHADYAEARIGVAVVSQPRCRGVLVLQSRRFGDLKYGFTLLYRGGERILGLDVNPGRWHIDSRTLKSIQGTHWQEIPDMSAATPDPRILSHRQWLEEFLRKANIEPIYWYKSPPRGEQLLLDL